MLLLSFNRKKAVNEPNNNSHALVGARKKAKSGIALYLKTSSKKGGCESKFEPNCARKRLNILTIRIVEIKIDLFNLQKIKIKIGKRR